MDAQIPHGNRSQQKPI